MSSRLIEVFGWDFSALFFMSPKYWLVPLSYIPNLLYSLDCIFVFDMLCVYSWLIRWDIMIYLVVILVEMVKSMNKVK